MWEGSPDPDYGHHAVIGYETVIGVWRRLPQLGLTASGSRAQHHVHIIAEERRAAVIDRVACFFR
jgi:hypothetical protein